MKNLILIRHLPGAGGTTLAKTLVAPLGSSGEHIEEDHWMVDQEPEGLEQEIPRAWEYPVAHMPRFDPLVVCPNCGDHAAVKSACSTCDAEIAPYKYDPGIAAYVRNKCSGWVAWRLRASYLTTVVVSNMFLREREVETYRIIAEKCRATLTVISLWDAGLTDQRLAERSGKWSESQIADFRAVYEHDLDLRTEAMREEEYEQDLRDEYIFKIGERVDTPHTVGAKVIAIASDQARVQVFWRTSSGEESRGWYDRDHLDPINL
jgi:hypothetical protein